MPILRRRSICSTSTEWFQPPWRILPADCTMRSTSAAVCSAKSFNCWPRARVIIIIIINLKRRKGLQGIEWVNFGDGNQQACMNGGFIAALAVARFGGELAWAVGRLTPSRPRSGLDRLPSYFSECSGLSRVGFADREAAKALDSPEHSEHPACKRSRPPTITATNRATHSSRPRK